ncbi:MAG: glycosyltransferase [Fischerella sp.]|nr:glycosyltransferase [Fischerella sp.]
MTLTQNLADLVSIGITTKNRWQDLKTTLTKIAESDLKELPILIFDDGSDQPCPFDISTFPLKIKLQRFAQSKGLIVRRNQLAQVMQTKYYLSLDDDSFPVAGSLQAAVEFAESRENIFCLSFPVFNPILKEHQNRSLQTQPYPVRFFIGCGHLLHRQHFLQLGGYREELIHQGEEMEIAARAFQAGLYCYHFPDFQIHHTASNIARNWWRMDYYGARNHVLWNNWFVPNELEWIKQIRSFTARVILAIKVSRIGSIQGQIAGIRDTYIYKKYRQKMSIQIFRQWESLPPH